MFGFLKGKERRSGKLQRRRFFRMPVSIKGDIYGPSDPECRHPMPCTIYDLSGNGAALKSYQVYDEAYTFRLRFCLPGDPLPITVACKTVRSALIKRGENAYAQHMYGVRFLEAEEDDVERIVKYITYLQRSRIDD